MLDSAVLMMQQYSTAAAAPPKQPANPTATESNVESDNATAGTTATEAMAQQERDLDLVDGTLTPEEELRRRRLQRFLAPEQEQQQWSGSFGRVFLLPKTVHYLFCVGGSVTIWYDYLLPSLPPNPAAWAGADLDGVVHVENACGQKN